MTGQPIQPGQVLEIPEAHYLYGVGPLKLRVTACDGITRAQEWVCLRGVQIIWDGSDGPDREVLVRVEALPAIVAGTATAEGPIRRPTNGLRITDPAAQGGNQRPPLPSHGRPRRWDEDDLD